MSAQGEKMCNELLHSGCVWEKSCGPEFIFMLLIHGSSGYCHPCEWGLSSGAWGYLWLIVPPRTTSSQLSSSWFCVPCKPSGLPAQQPILGLRLSHSDLIQGLQWCGCMGCAIFFFFTLLTYISLLCQNTWHGWLSCPSRLFSYLLHLVVSSKVI